MGTMIGRIIKLGPGECADAETGARYFSALAFPGIDEDQERRDATKAWVGAYLHEANRVDGSSEPFADDRLNEFTRLPEAWCREKRTTMVRRLRDRGDAARAVRPWIKDLRGPPHHPVEGISKFNQRQISLYLKSGDSNAAENFLKRVVRPSRPVLHLAIASEIRDVETGPGVGNHPLDLAAVSDFRELVALSNWLAPIICADPRFGVR